MFTRISQVFWFILLVSGLNSVSGFDNTRNDNLAVYWGQNSYGATHSDTGNFQKTLSFYCADNSIDVFPIAFLNVFFGPGGLPSIDLSNICSPVDDAVFPGSSLPNCQFLAADIQTCQAKGKIVTLSMGGGAAGGVSFSSASQAQTFGTTIWNLFLGGSSSTRPFGAAVLDGIDLDIEGGSTEFFDSFIAQIRSHASGASKKYYITAAPQCPYPDGYLGTVLNKAAFDAIYVQFYNNYCSLPNFNNPNDWDFASWDTWAKTVAINKNVKIYIGAPGASSAAGSGYVDVATLGNIARQTRSQYSSFGGVMIWDASQAYANNRFDAAIKSSLTNGGGSTPTTSTSKTTSTTSRTTTSTTTSRTTSSTTSKTTTTASSGSCAGVPAWSSGIAYNGGQQVVYNGHLWTANWWSEADVPGGSSGDWKDNGACTSFDGAATVAAGPNDDASFATTVKASSPAASSSSQARTAHTVQTSLAAKTPASAEPSDPVSHNNTGSKPANPTSTSKHSRFFRF